jgi:hypothetical protein
LEDFNDFAADANYWDDYTRLETDVNLAGRVYERAVIAPDTNNSNYVFDGTVFSGVFDGNDHKITNLVIDDGGAGGDFLGVFGFIDDGGEAKNLGLEGGSVSGTGDRIGGMVGVNLSSISNCYSTGDVSGTGADVGGLIGSNYGSASNCYSANTGSGDEHVGGLVGWNHSIVSHCYSTNSVIGNHWVGGLVGRNDGSVSNCYSTSDVSGYDDVGGLVGLNIDSVSNCYSTGDVNGVKDVGGLVGSNKSSLSNCLWDTETQSHGISDSIGKNDGTVTNVAGLTTAQMQMRSTFISSGWDFIEESANGTSETWQMLGGDGYPVLSFFQGFSPFLLTGSGTSTDPYMIGDANELGMVNWYPEDCCFKLTSDIDMSEIKWSVSVVLKFKGCFDGDGHKLSNMQISGSGWLGLFAFLGKGGEIRNIGLEGGSVKGTGDLIGGLAGKNGGSVSICYFSGETSGFRHVGGLIGYSYGSISSCYSTGDVRGTGWEVGGLVGQCRGTVSDCYCTGDVSGSSRVGGLAGYCQYGDVLNCYSTGDVSGDIDVGGLLGWNNYGSVLNCFWDTDTQTHGVTDSIGKNGGVNVKNVVGLPTAEMHTKSTFTSAGWDFTTPIWKMNCEGMSYPKLNWWQPILGDFLCPDGVDFFDYSFFTSHWQDDNCGASNDCNGTDLDLLGKVDINDLRIFVDNWLRGF